MSLKAFSNFDSMHSQLGIGAAPDLFAPSDEVLTGVLAVSAGGTHTCALMASFGIRCWGLNNFGQIGNDTVAYLSTPPAYDIPFISNVAAVSAGGLHTCVLTIQGGVRCWGRNANGQVEKRWHASMTRIACCCFAHFIGMFPFAAW